MWLLGYLPEIASDLSVFHRIDDASEMEAAVFFMLAARLPAYDGAFAAALARDLQDAQPGTATPAPAPAAPARPPASPGVLAELNQRLGGQHFSYTAVPASG